MQAANALYQARALYYDFFAGFFLYELVGARKDLFLEQIDILATSPINESDGEYFAMLRAYIAKSDSKEILREYTQTFNLPFSAQNLPTQERSKQGGKKSKKPKIPNPQIFLYLSHYLEGCLNGESLLRVRTLVKKTHFRLNAQEFKESEEHFGFLLLLMRHLLQDLDKLAENEQLIRELFTQAIAPMGLAIAEALAKREDLVCYHLVGLLLGSFLALEGHINS
ncbi:molecular chaperone TorD family protein [uncultured Helicobacter sp.]|uniref:molecular chaperone TorD family protein n=1 Tax=uncultured Helicobacter sp. TaxID=175537 RepID=UPI003752215D